MWRGIWGMTGITGSWCGVSPPGALACTQKEAQLVPQSHSLEHIRALCAMCPGMIAVSDAATGCGGAWASACAAQHAQWRCGCHTCTVTPAAHAASAQQEERDCAPWQPPEMTHVTSKQCCAHGCLHMRIGAADAALPRPRQARTSVNKYQLRKGSPVFRWLKGQVYTREPLGLSGEMHLLSSCCQIHLQALPHLRQYTAQLLPVGIQRLPKLHCKHTCSGVGSGSRTAGLAF